MDREMQQRLSEPLSGPSNHVLLSEFPIYGEFVNPGIGVQMYDFYVPLYGNENQNVVKETTKDPGSLSFPVNKNNFLKNETEKISNLKQEGFGNVVVPETLTKKNTLTVADLPNNLGNSAEKIEKLGSIYDAMKKAKVQTKELQYKPKKIKKIGVKKSINSFHLV